MIPKRAQYACTALRSFLRFLFVRGETETDLSLAVPTVRQWRLAGVPRHLPADEVELVLHSCSLRPRAAFASPSSPGSGDRTSCSAPAPISDATARGESSGAHRSAATS